MDSNKFSQIHYLWQNFHRILMSKFRFIRQRSPTADLSTLAGAHGRELGPRSRGKKRPRGRPFREARERRRLHWNRRRRPLELEGLVWPWKEKKEATGRTPDTFERRESAELYGQLMKS